MGFKQIKDHYIQLLRMQILQMKKNLKNQNLTLKEKSELKYKLKWFKINLQMQI